MELDGERGQYHFNARSYDPKLSRFFAPDLLFEMYPNQSPYAYSANNPVNFKDPSGMSPEYFGSSESQVVIAAPNGIDENRAAWESGRFGEMSGYMALGIRSCGLGFGSVGSGSFGGGGSSGIVDNGILTRNGITNISREESDNLFFKIFYVMGSLSANSDSFGKLGQLMQSFHTIVSTKVGLDMVTNIAEKLNGSQITLLGVTRSEMEGLAGGKFSTVYGLTSYASTKSLTINGNTTIRIALDFDSDGVYEGNGTFIDKDFGSFLSHAHYFDITYVFAHELGHVDGHSSVQGYNSLSSYRKEQYAEFKAWQILNPLGKPTSYIYEYSKPEIRNKK